MLQLILCGQLIDGTEADPSPRQAVLVEGQRIAWVGPQSELSRTHRRDARVLDFGEGTLLPGLIDTHVHLTFNAGPDHAAVRDALERETEAHLTLRAVSNAQAHLASGVTTVRDVGGPGFLTLAIRDAMNRGQVLGPTVRAAGPAITPTRGHLHYLGGVADGAEAVGRRARQVLDAGADLVKICATGGIMTAECDPLGIHYTAAELRSAVEAAEERGKLVAAHALAGEGVARCIEAGVRSIEHCLWQDAPGEFTFRPDLAERMKAQGSVAGLTFAGVGQARYRAEVLGEDTGAELGVWKDRMERRYTAERAMINAGVRYVLHSDAGVRATPFGAFWRVLAAACYELRLTPLEAIRAVTSTAAGLLGMEGEAGRIAVGHRADLLAVKRDPALRIEALAEPWLVMKGGDIVAGSGGTLLAADGNAAAPLAMGL